MTLHLSALSISLGLGGLWAALRNHTSAASMEVTLKAVSEIPDPSLRELEQVMIARGLLGVPVRRNMTASVGSFCTVETEVTYEQL